MNRNLRDKFSVKPTTPARSENGPAPLIATPKTNRESGRYKRQAKECDGIGMSKA